MLDRAKSDLELLSLPTPSRKLREHMYFEPRTNVLGAIM